MKILLGDVMATVYEEDIFKVTVGDKSLCEISNDSGVWVLN
jgi:hypothetical protein